MVFTAYSAVTNESLYGLDIVASILYSSQGLILAAAYFILKGMGKVEVTNVVPKRQSTMPGRYRSHLSVEEIRSNAKRKDTGTDELGGSGTETATTFNFSIFDGKLDADSPWARFIDPDSSDDAVYEKANEQYEQPLDNDERVRDKGPFPSD